MRIRVSDLTAEGVLIEEHLDPAQLKDVAALQESGECVFQGRLAVKLRIKPTAGMVQAEGHVNGLAILTCSRCLGPARWPLQAVFRLTYARTVPGDEADPPAEIRELEAEELGVVLYEGDEIDFREAIQEQVVMALPMQPLCGEACRGLCPGCGANLNEEPCGCTRREIDPRLAVLKNLKLDS